jgi:hypothetical protein
MGLGHFHPVAFGGGGIVMRRDMVVVRVTVPFASR